MDINKLQKDLFAVGHWYRTWDMRLNVENCKEMHFSNQIKRGLLTNSAVLNIVTSPSLNSFKSSIDEHFKGLAAKASKEASLIKHAAIPLNLTLNFFFNYIFTSH